MALSLRRDWKNFGLAAFWLVFGSTVSTILWLEGGWFRMGLLLSLPGTVVQIPMMIECAALKMRDERGVKYPV